jgi:hypothetical protein
MGIGSRFGITSEVKRRDKPRKPKKAKIPGVQVKNRFPGRCVRCWGHVGTGQGIADKVWGTTSKWDTYHRECWEFYAGEPYIQEALPKPTQADIERGYIE